MKGRHIERSEKHSIVPRLSPVAVPVLAFATMLALVPGALAQRSAGGHSSGFGGHAGEFARAGGFSVGAFRGRFPAPRSRH
ncbi:MAG: hypothetical protein ACRD3N_18155 [Terracidiphilus sp.]